MLGKCKFKVIGFKSKQKNYQVFIKLDTNEVTACKNGQFYIKTFVCWPYYLDIILFITVYCAIYGCCNTTDYYNCFWEAIYTIFSSHNFIEQTYRM